jgi:ATP-dependent 26S proteasome regulatory subunit
MHEASRRILSVLLQKVEGFASAKKTTVVCATNRYDWMLETMGRLGAGSASLTQTTTLLSQQARS